MNTEIKPGSLAEFVEAMNGPRGDLDAWLECNDEAEVRAHIMALVDAEREECAVLCESEPITMDGLPARRGPEWVGTWYEDSPVGRVVKGLAQAIRRKNER